MDETLHAHLKGFADSMTTALKSLAESSYAPDKTKKLRTFSAGEASYYLGVGDGYLRKAHFEDRIPDVEMGPGNRRRYTAEDIHSIRKILASTAKNPAQFQPGRRDLKTDELQVWTIVNFKGGSSKTTATLHLAHGLSLCGYKVLCLDVDAQSSLTTFFGYIPEIDFFDKGSIYDAIRYKDLETGEGPCPFKDIVRSSYFPNLDIAPGGIQLAEFEHEIPGALSRHESPIFFKKISDALEEVKDDYDIVLIDCPPQLGYLSLSAICAAKNLIMTLIPERIDMASAAQFLNMASSLTEVIYDNDGIKKFDNFRFLLSRYDTSIATQVDFAEYIRELFGDAVMESAFLKSSAISEAGVYQKSVLEVDLSTVKNRKTYDRAIESVHNITKEVEGMIQANWGRTT